MLLNEAFNLPFKQSEVDFLIPNLNEDLNLYVDPFLFYKSSNPRFQAVHATIHKFFEIAIQLVNEGDVASAKRMISFPEVEETMLGLCTGDHAGRGMGIVRDAIIYKEIVSNPDILANGIEHLAEMQLLIEGVGFDMISDMCTNISKSFFISYTQEQCSLHNIPIEHDVCLNHVFDWDELIWDDIHASLPVNPKNGKPILLVPKKVVRRFAEIDYKGFWNDVYRYMLRDIEVNQSMKSIGRAPKVTWKEIEKKYDFSKRTVVAVLHKQPDLKRNYIAKVESKSASSVQFSLDLTTVEGVDSTSVPYDNYISELKAIKPGKEDCKKYEDLMVRIITRLFSPYLSDPHAQVTSEDGREIIDITYYNSADRGFWHDMKIQHNSLIVVFELKNMTDLANEELFQIASRLDDRKGRFGILISRDKDKLDIQRAYRRMRNDNKIILILTDSDLTNIIEDVKNGLSSTLYLNKMYRKFVEEA